MGTNYYALKHPNISEKEALHKLIDEDKFYDIKSKVSDLYASPHIDFGTMTLKGGYIHLGKRSAGWKFLWNPNIYAYKDYQENYKIKTLSIYPLTKSGIKSFISQDDITIIDEYDEIQDKEEFWNMAINWNLDGWDSDAYNDWDFRTNGKKDIYKCESDLITYLKEQNYHLSELNHDFYSDGLRFATHNEFS